MNDRRSPPDNSAPVQRMAELTESLEQTRVRRRFLLLHRLGRRGAALLFFAVLDAIYAFSLLRPTPADRLNPTMGYLEHLVPLWVLGLMWAASSLVCLGNAFRVRDRWGFTAAIAVKVCWALLNVGAWRAGVPRAYISVTLWLCLAGFVAVMATWPEPVTLPDEHDPPRR